MARTYEGKMNLKSGGVPITVTATAISPQEAKRILEAQYGSQFKSWYNIPNKVVKY